jgi:hypothetical protein
VSQTIIREESVTVFHKGWRNAGLIILTGLAILLISVFLYYNGNTMTLSVFASSLAPILAFFLGVIGLSAYGRESLVKDDRFHALNVWMALGLIVFSLSEVAGVMLHTLDSSEILFIIGLVQIPALLLWGLGILGYLRSSNSALGESSEGLWARVILIASIAGLTLIVVETLYFPGRSIVQMGIAVPMVIGLSVILLALGRLLWVLREGLIVRPLILLFLGVLLYLIRNLFWNYVEYAPGLPFDYITAIESYILVGASLIAASRLEEVYDEAEEIEE